MSGGANTGHRRKMDASSLGAGRTRGTTPKRAIPLTLWTRRFALAVDARLRMITRFCPGNVASHHLPKLATVAAFAAGISSISSTLLCPRRHRSRAVHRAVIAIGQCCALTASRKWLGLPGLLESLRRSSQAVAQAQPSTPDTSPVPVEPAHCLLNLPLSPPHAWRTLLCSRCVPPSILSEPQPFIISTSAYRAAGRLPLAEPHHSPSRIRCGAGCRAKPIESANYPLESTHRFFCRDISPGHWLHSVCSTDRANRLSISTAYSNPDQACRRLASAYNRVLSAVRFPSHHSSTLPIRLSVAVQRTLRSKLRSATPTAVYQDLGAPRTSIEGLPLQATQHRLRGATRFGVATTRRGPLRSLFAKGSLACRIRIVYRFRNWQIHSQRTLCGTAYRPFDPSARFVFVSDLSSDITQSEAWPAGRVPTARVLPLCLPATDPSVVPARRLRRCPIHHNKP